MTGMTSLPGLEQAFQAFVIAGTPGIERAIVATPRVSVERRLAIYADAYRARLAEALDNNFPVLGKLLGDAQSAELARRYVQAHPSANFSIRSYGDRLAAFLATTSPYREQLLLSELAQWEWCMTLAFDAADAAPLRASSLQTLTPEQWADLRFTVHPSAQRLSLWTNAPATWRALNRDEPPPAAVEGELQAWLIWRRGLDTFYRSIEALEAEALMGLQRGESFARLCERLSRALGEEGAAEQAARFLRRWVDDELLAAT
jgi:hypothetical protein